MAVLTALLTVVAVFLLATLPCLAMMLLVFAGDARNYVVDSVRRWRAGRVCDPTLSRRERRRLTRLNRSLPPAPHSEPEWPPIERIAADLRRLRGHRTGIALRSPVWFAAIEQAYDDRLTLACQRLHLPCHLGTLTGVDRDIERLRVEGELEAAGLYLHGYQAAPS